MEPAYRPVCRRRLTDEVVDQIQDLIVKSELRVGDPLPPERELAQRLQVSRNVLRHAVGMLSQKGLVEVRPGSGTYVTHPSGSFIGESLHFLLQFDSSLLLDLLKARLLIESETAALAAQYATPENLQAMKTALDTMNQYSADPDRYIEADLSFHTELAHAAGNQVLFLLLMSVRAALRENIRHFARDVDAIVTSTRYHHHIYEAVAAHQSEVARQAMRDHFALTIERERRSPSD